MLALRGFRSPIVVVANGQELTPEVCLRTDASAALALCEQTHRLGLAEPPRKTTSAEKNCAIPRVIAQHQALPMRYFKNR